jgi:hypothetical protein
VASATPITLTSEETSTLEEISSVQQAADRLAVGFRGKSRETDASQGVQVEMIQALADYWATDYDWRKFEERFSALPSCHFRLAVDRGARICKRLGNGWA